MCWNSGLRALGAKDPPSTEDTYRLLSLYREPERPVEYSFHSVQYTLISPYIVLLCNHTQLLPSICRLLDLLSLTQWMEGEEKCTWGFEFV
jgi:hypothetical protein